MKPKQSGIKNLGIPEKLETLKQFYRLMQYTRQIRQEIFDFYLQNDNFTDVSSQGLQVALERLESLPGDQDGYGLLRFGQQIVRVDLGYEKSELKKDIFFLTHPFQQFYDYLCTLHPEFRTRVPAAVRFLNEVPLYNWITDRDGTVNNYCGRYLSSVQSLYNAVFLSRFAAQRCRHKAVILTSAPLQDGGLLDVSVVFSSLFIYAGSKGREFMDNSQVRYRYPVSAERQVLLNELNTWLKKIVTDPRYEIFSLIGSGLQFKWGETAIAYQDVGRSIPVSASTQFIQLVKTKVSELDPMNVYLKAIETGTDLEIVLTTNSEGPDSRGKEFDKGDGVRFIHRSIGLQLKKGITLVCGDTGADVAMVQAVREEAGQVRALFVTGNRDLQQRVSSLCPEACFVSNPDILATALYLGASEL